MYSRKRGAKHGKRKKFKEKKIIKSSVLCTETPSIREEKYSNKGSRYAEGVTKKNAVCSKERREFSGG